MSSRRSERIRSRRKPCSQATVRSPRIDDPGTAGCRSESGVCRMQWRGCAADRPGISTTHLVGLRPSPQGRAGAAHMAVLCGQRLLRVPA